MSFKKLYNGKMHTEFLKLRSRSFSIQFDERCSFLNQWLLYKFAIPSWIFNYLPTEEYFFIYVQLCIFYYLIFSSDILRQFCGMMDSTWKRFRGSVFGKSRKQNKPSFAVFAVFISMITLSSKAIRILYYYVLYLLVTIFNSSCFWNSLILGT